MRTVKGVIVRTRDNRVMPDGPLQGMTIGVTAERRAAQQRDLLTKRGADVLHGPTLRVFSLEGDEVLKAATVEVIARPPDFLVASTGYGIRTWLAAATSWGMGAALQDALGNARVANRGAKAASATNGLGWTEWYRAPHERLEELVDRLSLEPLADSRVVLQLHGVTEPAAVAALEARGAEVIAVDAYRLSLPLDPAPARRLVRAACADEVAAITFVSAPAVHNLFTLAGQIGLDDDLRRSLNGRVVAACVGPVCAEGAAEEGVVQPVVPARSRLVPMVQALTDHLRQARTP